MPKKHEYEFYNPEDKEAFLKKESKENPNPQQQVRFNTRGRFLAECTPWEQKFDTDLGAMSHDQMMEMAESFNDVSYMALSDRVTTWNKYIDWYCKSKNKYPQVFDWRKVNLAPAFRRSMCGGPDFIIRDWENIQDPAKGQYAIPIYLLLWYGVDIQDAIELKKEDVIITEDKVTVHYKDQTLEIIGKKFAEVFCQYRDFAFCPGTKDGWVRANVPYFFSNRIRSDADDEEAILNRVRVYSMLRACRLRNPYLDLAYDGTRFAVAGKYWRIVQIENERGEQMDQDEISQYILTAKRAHFKFQGIRMTIDAYKRAFDLYE